MGGPVVGAGAAILKVYNLEIEMEVRDGLAGSRTL